jgi:cation diffusion facilitator CzcD-associated flavoprotein CzcO
VTAANTPGSAARASPEQASPVHTSPEQVGFLIIGAGFSGLGAAMKLLAAGHTELTVLERADDVGGTWRDNVYPGCRCDVQSNLYSYSFALKPDWS